MLWYIPHPPSRVQVLNSPSCSKCLLLVAPGVPPDELPLNRGSCFTQDYAYIDNERQKPVPLTQFWALALPAGSAEISAVTVSHFTYSCHTTQLPSRPPDGNPEDTPQ